MTASNPNESQRLHLLIPCHTVGQDFNTRILREHIQSVTGSDEKTDNMLFPEEVMDTLMRQLVLRLIVFLRVEKHSWTQERPGGQHVTM